mgnify:CR=1 FL=1
MRRCLSLTLLTLPLTTLLAAGCTGPNLDTDPLVVPGTGETEFIALTGGVDELPLTNGVQGGTHVWGALRATGMDWNELTVTWEITDEDGLRVTEPTTIRQQLAPCTTSDPACEPGMGELVAVTVVMDDPGSVRGDELTMTVDASDADGRSASATTQVRPIFSVE